MFRSLDSMEIAESARCTLYVVHCAGLCVDFTRIAESAPAIFRLFPSARCASAHISLRNPEFAEFRSIVSVSREFCPDHSRISHVSAIVGDRAEVVIRRVGTPIGARGTRRPFTNSGLQSRFQSLFSGKVLWYA